MPIPPAYINPPKPDFRVLRCQESKTRLEKQRLLQQALTSNEVAQDILGTALHGSSMVLLNSSE